MRISLIIIILVHFGKTAFGIEQDYYQSLINDANQSYQENQWDSALSNYQKVLDSGLKSSTLYYNVANSHFKLGNVAEAILFYERSLKLTPGDADVVHNLNIANKHIIDEIEALPPIFYIEWINSFRNSFSTNGWSYFGIVFFWIFCAVVILFILTQSETIKKISFVFALPLLLISLTGFLMANQSNNQCQSSSDAIVFQASVNVHSEPSSSSTRLFVVHEGLKVEVSQFLNNWYEVVLPDGSKGWIEADELQII